MSKPFFENASFDLWQEDCQRTMARLPDNSIDAIITDPPFYKVKGEKWDRQWSKPEAFLDWVGSLCLEFQRILKPNGSLYFFASPQMASRVECKIRETFQVLNNISWLKKEGRHKGCHKEDLRAFFPQTEKIIFAEHYGADNIAKGQPGYAAKCDELRGFIFEPLRAYMDGERVRAGFSPKDCNTACSNQMAGHYFSRVQWVLPTEANYNKLRRAFNAKRKGKGGAFLDRDFQFLRREFEDLRQEYDKLRKRFEDLRRPFGVTSAVPYTDVWDFEPVQCYPGKHPCEKPVALMEHIVRTSTRPGAVVFDPFMGSGATVEAALGLGRRVIGVDMSKHWCDYTKKRVFKKFSGVSATIRFDGSKFVEAMEAFKDSARFLTLPQIVDMRGIPWNEHVAEVKEAA